MSANFPSTPTLNQVYSYNGSTWRWNGRYWQAETVAEIAGATGATGTAGATGATGPTGLGFSIAKTYASVAAITADTAPTGITAGQFAIIDNGNYGTDSENSRLYLWTGTTWQYVTDLSGAQGIQGPAGATGAAGTAGTAGATGATGTTGGVGATGTAGATGIQGNAGPIGATGLSGTSANIVVYDEGNLIIGQVSSFNFVGMGITANSSGSNVTVTVTATGTGGGFYYANTAPATPVAGDRWVNSDSLREFVYVNDGDSSQWIETVKFQQQGATGATGPGANIAALSGNLIPAANITYDLGSALMRWRDLYLSGNSIYLGSTVLTATENTLNLPSGTKIGNVNVATTQDVAVIASATSPKVANIQVADNTWTVLDDTAVDTAGGYILVNGSGFVSVPQVYINNQAATTVSYVSSSQLRVQVPAQSAGTYPMYVINSDGGTAILVPGVSYSGFPAWSSPAAGNVGQNYEMETISTVSLNASSNSAVSYVLASGSLPPGVTLSGSSISGTTQSTATNTTYNFTIEARDAENQSTLRNFSLTVNTDVVTWASPANGTVLSGYEFAGVSQALSASSAAGRGIQYSGSGLPANVTVTGSTVAGNLAAATNATTASNTAATLTATANVTLRSANRTVYFVANPDQVTWASPTSNGVVTGYEFSNLSAALSATSAAGRTITYSGANLPTNITVTGSTLGGLLGAVGNASSNLTATAATTDRANTIPVTIQTIADVVTWSTPTNSQTISIDATAAVNQALSATSAAGKTITYTANNLPTGLSVVGAAVTGTPSGYTSTTAVTSNLTATAAVTNRSSTISITWTINLGVIFTDAFFSNVSLLLNAASNASVISDASSNNLQISPFGDVRASTFSPYNTGWSNFFDGTGGSAVNTDSLTIADNSAFNLSNLDFTIEAWIYLTATPTVSVRICEKIGAANVGYLLAVTSASVLTFACSTDGQTTNISVGASQTVPLNVWTHVAATRIGNVFTVWMNGTSSASSTNNITIFNSTATFMIGNQSVNDRTFPGYISNFRLVKGVGVYTGNFSVPTSPLRATQSAGTNIREITGTQTSLLTCHTNRFVDGSTNNFAITRTGDVAVRSFNPFNLTNTGTAGSMYFDGTDDQVTTPSSAIFAFTGTWTIECWFYVATTSPSRLWQMSDDKDNCEVNSPSAGYVNYYNGGSSVNSSTAVFAPFSWNHLAAVCTSNSTKMYVNGVLAITHTTSNSSTRYIGIGGNSNLDFVGYIADFRVVTNRVMYPAAYPDAALTTANNTVLLLNNSLTNNATNNTFLDSSANNFTITRNGNVTQGSFSPFSPGGWSVYGSGSTSYLQLNNSDYAISTGDFTIEFWMYLTSDKANTCFCSSPSNPNLTVAMTLGSAGARLYYLEYGGTGTTFGAGSNYLNTWTHVAFVRSSGTVTCYQNGNAVNVGGTSKSAAVGSTANLYLLRNSGDTNQDLPGYISNFRICKSAVYATSFTPSTTTLTTTSQGATNCVLLAFQNNRFKDNSSNNSTITPTSVSVQAFAPFTPAAYVPATHGGSAYFDGSGDFLSVANNAALNLTNGDFTIECWFYSTGSLASSPIIIQKDWNPGVTYSQYGFGINSGGTLFALLGNGSSTEQAISGITPIAQNTWNHAAYTLSGSSLRLFLNGNLQVTGTRTVTAASGGGSLVVGSGGTAGTNRPFTGYVSNLRLVNGYALYTAAFTVPAAPVTAVYGTQLLLNATNAAIWDASGRNNFETIGDAKVSTAAGRYSLASLAFDGTGDFLTIPYNQNFNFGTGDFTVECWANITYVQYAAIITSTAVSIVTGHWLLGYSNTANQMAFGIDSSGVATVGADYTSYLSTWTHIAASRSGTTLRLFFNGVQVASVTNSTSFTGDSGNPIAIGRRYTNSANYFLNGYISDLRITAGQAVYTTSFSVPTRSLTAVDRTQLLTLQNNQPHNNHTFQDSGPYNHLITRAGNASQGTFSPFAPGGWSVFFSGSGNYLNTPNTGQFAPAGDFTIGLWVYPTDVATSTQKFIGNYTGINSTDWTIVQDLNTTRFFTNGNLPRIISPAGSLLANTWNYIALVRVGSTITAYINGTSVGSYTQSGTFGSPTKSIYIGADGALNAYIANGYISNVLLVDGTAYTAVPTAPSTAVSGTRLLTLQDNRFVDRSTSAVTFTRTGDVRITAFSPFAPTTSYSPAVHGGSLYLDGSGDYLQFGNGELALDLNGDSSIELWFYPLATNMILTAKYSNVGSNQFYINADGSNKIYAEFLGSTYYAKTSTASYILRSWNHLLITKTGTTAKMWLNGVYDGAWTVSSTNSTTKAIAIGASTDNYGTTTANGYISSLRYSRSATETGTSNVTLPTAPLPLTANTVALFNFVADGIEDRSGRGVLETVADARHSRAVAKFANTSSMYFDGTGDYLRFPTSERFQLLAGSSTTFTIESWVYKLSNPSASNQYPLITTLDIQATYYGYFFSITDAGKLIFGHYYTGNNTANRTGNTVLANNTWYHVALVVLAGTFKIYVNGVEDSPYSDSNAGSLGSTTQQLATAVATIGGPSVGAPAWQIPLNGYLQDLRVTRTARYQPSAPTANLTVSSSTVLLVPGGTGNNVIRDASANNFTNFTILGDTRASNFTPYSTGWSNYFSSAGIAFSGSNNIVNFGTNDWTIECWFNGSVSGAATYVWSWDYYLLYAYNNTIIFYRVSPGADLLVMPVVNNTWYHVAVTKVSGVHSMYLNGIKHGSTWTDNNSVTQAAAFTIGKHSSVAANYFEGSVSNLRIVKGQALFTSSFVPSTLPLSATAVGHTGAGAVASITGTVSLLTCQSNRFIDNSSNNYAYTASGTPRVSSFNPFNVTNTGDSGSMYFDGSGDYITIPASQLPLLLKNSDFTCEAWVYRTGGGGASVLGGQSDFSTAGGSSYVFYINTAGTSDLYSGSSGYGVTSPQPIIGQWSHVAWVRTGGTYSSYLNGVRVGTNATLGTASVNDGSASNRGAIAGWSNGTNLVTGYIADLRLIKGSGGYDATQSTITVPTAPLTATTNTQLLMFQYRQPHNNHSFQDSSPNQFLITRNGNASQSTFSPFSPYGWSAYLGSSDQISSTTSSPSVVWGWSGSTTTLSMEYWVFAYSFPGFQIMADQSAHLNYLMFSINSSAQPNWYWYSGGGYSCTATNKVTAGRWNHVSTSIDNGVISIYIDGVKSPVTGTTTASSAGGTGRLAIGSGPFYVSNLRVIRNQAIFRGDSFTVSTSPLTTTTIGHTGPGVDVTMRGYVSLLIANTATGAQDQSYLRTAFSITGTPQFVPFSPFSSGTYSPSVHSGSLYLDGSGDYLTLSPGTAFAFGTGDFTVEAWIYITQASNGALFDVTPNSGTFWNVKFNGTGFVYQAPIGTNKISGTAPHAPNSGWHHIAVVRRSGTSTMYFDGASIGTAADTVDFAATTTYGIGRNFDVNTESSGWYSSIRVVKGTALYTANFTPPTTALTSVPNTQLLLNFSDAAVADQDTINVLETMADAREVNFGPLMSNYSVYFDGTGDYLTVADNASGGLDLGSGQFTVEFWWYPTSSANGQYVLIGDSSGDWYVVYDASQLQFGRRATQNDIVSTGYTLTANTWQHFVVARQSTGSNDTRIFVNGILRGVGTTSQNYVITTTLGIGSLPAGGNAITGYLSSLRIVKGSVPAEYQTASTTTGTQVFTSPTSSATAIPGTSLLTCHANRFRDSSTNNFAITRTGDAKVTDFSPFGAQVATPPSIYFDGTGDYIKIPSTPALAFGTGDFTIEMWYYTETTSGWRGLYSSAASDNQANTMRLMLENTNTSVNLKVGSTFYTFTTTLLVAQWNHIALVRSNGTISFYYNGQRNATTASDTTSISSNLVTLGANFTGGTELFTGYLSDVRVTAGRALYGGFEPPTQAFPTR